MVSHTKLFWFGCGTFCLSFPFLASGVALKLSCYSERNATAIANATATTVWCEQRDAWVALLVVAALLKCVAQLLLQSAKWWREDEAVQAAAQAEQERLNTLVAGITLKQHQREVVFDVMHV